MQLKGLTADTIEIIKDFVHDNASRVLWHLRAGHIFIQEPIFLISVLVFILCWTPYYFILAWYWIDKWVSKRPQPITDET
jgi:hypothetical protein